MRLTVNGEPREVPDGTTVADLIKRQDGDPQRPGVAVAVNGTVVRRLEWPDTELSAGDKVEIVGAVQGGSA